MPARLPKKVSPLEAQDTEELHLVDIYVPT